MTRHGISRSEFESLYDSCAQTLLGFLVRRTGDPHTARDLWAETFAQAFAGRRRFRGSTPQEAESWLYAIAYRQLAQYHRRGAIEQRALRRLATDPPPLSDADLERLHELAGLAQLSHEVDAAMDRLPAALRIPLARVRESSGSFVLVAGRDAQAGERALDLGSPEAVHREVFEPLLGSPPASLPAC